MMGGYSNRMNLPPLPESFLFGTGNSDGQCEAFDARFADIRDAWYEERRLQPRLRATDFWNRYPEDIGLAGQLGCKLFRFSIAWSRVEPTSGQFSQEALDHYSQLVDAIRAAGMEPFVTLLHFTWPIDVETKGGLLANEFPATFATYVSRVAVRLGGRVKYWTTFNEPNVLSIGYIKPWWERVYAAPPGLPPDAGFPEQVASLHQLMRNLFQAHAAARTVIQQVNPSALVGANPAVLGLPVWLQRFMDRNVTNLKRPEDDRGTYFAERRYLERGKVDVVVAAFTKTNERASALDFAEVYLVATQRLMVLASSAVMAPNDLDRMKVAVVSKSTAEATGALVLPQSTLISFDRHEDAVTKLESGEVAALLTDDTRIAGIMRQTPGRYRMLDAVLSTEPYAPAVTKGNPKFLAAVNAAVRGFIESGAWAESFRRNLGEPVPEPPRAPTLASLSHLSGPNPAYANHVKNKPRRDLLDVVRKRRRVVIAVKDNVPGLGFRGENGIWTGLEIDIARAIAKYIFGNEGALELVPVATKQRISILRSMVRLFDPLYKLWGILASSSTTGWWNLGMAGKLPGFLCPSGCDGQLDFVAFDYYWGISILRISRFMALVEALTTGRFDEAPVFSGALYDWLKELSGMFPKLPIFICENGCVEEADGIDRSSYIRMHVAEVQRAVKDGVRVAGYMNWSVTTNRELGDRLSPHTDFGLYHIDLDNDPQLVRHVTPAAEVFRDIIRQRGV